MQPLSWDEFRLVKAIADTRTLAGAAETLSLNHSTVFRRLNAVEDQLGSRLFERSRTGYALTAAGEEMLELADHMAERIVAFERKVAGRDVKPSGELRVTTADTIFAALLAPILVGFREQCPDIRVEVLVENRDLNLSRRDADVALRAAREPPETLVGRRIASIGWAAFAPRALAAPDGTFPDVAAVPWIGYGEPLAQIAPALDALAGQSEAGVQEGVRLLQHAISQPLAIIAGNAGADGAAVVGRVQGEAPGIGFDARTGQFGDMFAAGVIDPVKVTYTALQNAVSVAKLILTTHILVVDLPEGVDPTAGPARGGGAERYGLT